VVEFSLQRTSARITMSTLTVFQELTGIGDCSALEISDVKSASIIDKLKMDHPRQSPSRERRVRISVPSWIADSSDSLDSKPSDLNRRLLRIYGSQSTAIDQGIRGIREIRGTSVMGRWQRRYQRCKRLFIDARDCNWPSLMKYIS